MEASDELTDAEYVGLADFRHAIRAFQTFSETQAMEVGLTAQQHQALLAIRASTRSEATVTYVAERLVLKPNSASGLIDRLEAQGLIARERTSHDRRVSILKLTAKGQGMLGALSAVHREEIRRLRPHLVELLAGLA